jgi:hypothetical protein
MSDYVAFGELSIEAAIGVRTGASRLLAPLHTCFMTECDSEIQAGSGVPELLEKVNNTSLKKHPKTREF